MDDLESEIGISIQHNHYDISCGKVVGSERRPVAWPKKGVDGYYGPFTAIEFLGDYFHGNLASKTPSQELYDKTERTLAKLASLGYVVLYVWERDYKGRAPGQTVTSLLRVFEGKLECE